MSQQLLPQITCLICISFERNGTLLSQVATEYLKDLE
jgi:hypothetical protein